MKIGAATNAILLIWDDKKTDSQQAFNDVRQNHQYHNPTVSQGSQAAPQIISLAIFLA